MKASNTRSSPNDPNSKRHVSVELVFLPPCFTEPLCQSHQGQRNPPPSSTVKKAQGNSLIHAVHLCGSQRASSAQLENGLDYHLLLHPHHTGTNFCMYGWPPAWSSSVQHVEHPSAPPSSLSANPQSIGHRRRPYFPQVLAALAFRS